MADDVEGSVGVGVCGEELRNLGNVVAGGDQRWLTGIVVLCLAKAHVGKEGVAQTLPANRVIYIATLADIVVDRLGRTPPTDLRVVVSIRGAEVPQLTGCP